ncbi:sacsin N-terminal ATP-binding-like domain-containing protein [Micrococcus sp.]|uniref:sacsin N-terminal ATP-binding-like domain-containing protein n=1 Tax=Micrococcus sp. TaxID=1271 RepID=UPI0026DCFC6F|nr:DEAD/DEAH box helicase family protein [Micrococcus sp.]MDO4239354.1 DEAD/DEAH box helicase family protein [Micrococcus sp.]
MTSYDTGWRPDEAFSRRLQDLRDNNLGAYRKNPLLVEEHANHEEQISVGGYARRVVRELVQNAADAMAGQNFVEPGKGRIRVVLDRDRHALYVANTGRPVSISGLGSLTHSHLSVKRGDEIGKYGLGFKSVLSVCERPEVFSRSVSFAFGAPEDEVTLRTIAPGLTRYPTLRVAHEIDANENAATDPVLTELMSWASTVVRLPSIRDDESLVQEIKNFDGLFLLFVEHVATLEFVVTGREPLDITHSCTDLGGGLFSVTNPAGGPQTMVVAHTDHRPSIEARRQAGTTVTRETVRVSVAIPTGPTKDFTGAFWSYFPLQDRTSLTAVLNAPWALVDDRTTMISASKYNQEIEDTLLDLFLDNLHKAYDHRDPGKLLDYLPARASRPGEALNEADYRLRIKCPRRAAARKLVPDAAGKLCAPDSLRPFFSAPDFPPRLHQDWQDAANTEDDVPHWSCYTTNTRSRRLRELYTSPLEDMAALPSAKTSDSLLKTVPQRSLNTWFREWAAHATPETAYRVLQAAALLASESRAYGSALETTPFIPTEAGMRSPHMREQVFIKGDDGYSAEGFTFVSDELTRMPRAKELLKEFGIVALAPTTKIKAQLKQLNAHDSVDVHAQIWQAISHDLSPNAAVGLLRAHGESLLIPVLDGSWKRPEQVLDFDELLTIPEAAGFTLDRSVVRSDLARALGVVFDFIKHYPLACEPLSGTYHEALLADLNTDLPAGERGVESVTFDRQEGPGPFSLLVLAAQTGVDLPTRVRWTKRLLALGGHREWTAIDNNTGDEYVWDAPHVWAAVNHGLLDTVWGPRPPLEQVSARLLAYRDLLPRSLETDHRILASLDLPDSLEDIEFETLASYFDEAMQQRDDFAELARDRNAAAVLEEFCTTITARYETEGLRLNFLPAFSESGITPTSCADIFVGKGAEQLSYLRSRGKRFLESRNVPANLLAEQLGVRDFGEVYSSSVAGVGRGEPELIRDRFTGLADYDIERILRGKYMVMCENILKETQSPEGTVSTSLQVHLDDQSGEFLYVTGLTDEELLRRLGEAFALDLTEGDIQDVLETKLSDELELRRVEAKSADSDAERLELYLGSERLMESLPPGLWEGLHAQGAVDDGTSAADLCLTVHGTSTIKELRDSFRDVGYSDVPDRWGRNRATLSWLERMGFPKDFAPEATEDVPSTVLVEGAVDLPELHPFQRRVADQIQEKILSPVEGGRSQKFMVDMPTGVGKTRVAVQSILELFTRGDLEGPVLWIAESQELCEQAVQTWRFVWRGLLDLEPLTVGRLWDTKSVAEPATRFSVIVATDAKLASILKNPAEAEDYKWLSQASVVVVDEAHRSGSSPMYTKILGWLGVDGRNHERPLIGLSATPFKGGDAGTDQLAARYGRQRIAGFTSENPYSEAIQGGYLARFDHRILDGVDVRLNARERAAAQSTRRIEQTVLDRIGNDQARTGRVVDDILNRIPADWPVLVFTPSVVSAQVLAATLSFHGQAAAAVSGKTSRSERRRIIEDFKAGKIRILTNCDLLVQGFDAPGVRALYIARPTFSRTAYIQMVGRGLRGPKNGGKEKCEIIDIRDNFGDSQDLLDHVDYIDQWNKE